MKAAKLLLLGAVIALTANHNLDAQVFLPKDLSNRAVAASPRAKEEFPWLTRQASPVAAASDRASIVSLIRQNRAFAASPRVREKYPELTLGEQSFAVSTGASAVGGTDFDRAIKNPALAASPRMKEKFPQLTRGYSLETAENPIEIAPVK